MDIQTQILKPSGALLLTLDAESQAEFAEEMARPDRTYWGTICDLFESEICNGGFQPFDGGDGNPFVGLTSAPCIAEEMASDEDGKNHISGRLWTFPDYMIRDPFKELAEHGRVTFELVGYMGGPDIPESFPVQPLRTPSEQAAAADLVTCGHFLCGLSWDDGVATGYTPTPAGRCPFEAFHGSEEESES